MRQVRAETLRKYEILCEYFKGQQEKSIFNKTIRQDDQEYVLLGLNEEECKLVLDAPYEPVARDKVERVERVGR